MKEKRTGEREDWDEENRGLGRGDLVLEGYVLTISRGQDCAEVELH